MDKIPGSEITDRRVYLRRRELLSAIVAAAGGAPPFSWRAAPTQPAARHGRRLTTVASRFSTSEKGNSWEHITTYNNFYEFGTGKDDPARFAPRWQPRQPWTVAIQGECAKPGMLTLDDILKGQTLEDRIYRHPCVEGWSMVSPWVVFRLANFIKR